MSKAQNAKGTRDFASSEVRKRQFIFNTIISVYERFGFEPLETPAMENIETLTGKYGEEGDQLLFRVLRSGNFLSKTSPDELHPDNINTLRAKIVDKGLRYDLTIPFARFVAKNHQLIGLPFKRYQIQPVWRADRPAKGRYREFYQCDADVVGTDSLLSDSEFIVIVDRVFQSLGLPTVTTHINNRKVLYGIAENHGVEDRFVAMTVAFDKLDKIGVDGVMKELAQRDFSQEEIETLVPYLSIEGSNEEQLAFLQQAFTQTETGKKGIAELHELLGYVNQANLNHSQANINVALARGLNYYTGTIYEVTLDGIDMGSVASGGRYDDLTGVFGLKGVPGVGLSFGAERIYDVMEQLQLFPALDNDGVKVFFANMDEETTLYAYSVMNTLRDAGISCDMYPVCTKLNKQFKHAERRNARYMALIGSEELKQNALTLKDQTSGEQKTLTVDEAIELLK